MPLYRPMRARNTDEEHRVSTSLELLFDLCFVVAVSQLVGQWHHAAIDGQFLTGIARYAMGFFAIWWSWMNFTWFASAFDTDDVVYRICVLVQIAGNLTIAAGVPRAFQSNDFVMLTMGYVIMRISLVALWLRVVNSDPTHRDTARRYAIGICVLQIGWLLRLLRPEEFAVVVFLVLVAAELSVPILAELRHATPWHPHHIAERFSLFTLIVIGESVLGATVSFQTAIDERVVDRGLIALGIGGLLIFFSMWWLYFAQELGPFLAEFQRTRTLWRNPFVFAYGHYFIFAFAAAVGAGLEIAVDMATDHAAISDRQCSALIAIPVALFIFSVLLTHVYFGGKTRAGALACLVGG
ncbi:MAG TPA: low temperature requirement protein A, partial [Thermomicrobiales bacterium]|nr:low temperature requirement protein A [Thermomicrobiales bacterium]